MDQVQQRRQQVYPPKLEQERRRVLYDTKWQKLLRRAWLFRHIPFVDFAFGSGSMAIGNVDEESDFDVLVGARQKRIFTARFFSILFFGLRGWRRSKADHGQSASDKICLNHFVTPAAYHFSLLTNDYWKLVYQNLVPIFGDERYITLFMNVNKKLIDDRSRIATDLRYQYRKGSFFKRCLERLLAGRLGDWFERFIKKMQVERIEAGLLRKSNETHRLSISVPGAKPATYHLQPLIRYSDIELEFHPDPAVIEVNEIISR